MKPETCDHSRSIIPSNVLPAPRFRYSPIIQAGDFVFISGMVGLDPATGSLAEGGTYQQTRQILRNLGDLCNEQAWNLDQLLIARIFCSDPAGSVEVNRAWEEAFENIEPPTRTFVVVSALPLNAAVEIEFQLMRRAKC